MRASLARPPGKSYLLRNIGIGPMGLLDGLGDRVGHRRARGRPEGASKPPCEGGGPDRADAATAPVVQNIHQQGSGNVAVTARQSSVNITIGSRAKLTLVRRHASGGRPRSELDLLRAEVAAVPLVGREKELGELEAWLEKDEPVSVHAIVGGAGSGKTRLALELCRRAEDRGWQAGFVSADEIERFAEHEPIDAWDRDGPALVVVDYAARSARSLNRVLRGLVGRPQAHKVRFLVLERHAEREGGWWAELRRIEGSSEDAVLDWFTGTVPRQLASLREPAERQAILEGTLQALSRYSLRKNVPELPPPGSDPAFERALAEPGADRAPLFLVMAALFTAEAGLATALALGRLDLALWLAIRERDRLAALAKHRGVDPEFLPHLVARITLSRGLSRDALDAVIREEREALGIEEGAVLERVHRALTDALPVRRDGGAESLGFLEPDLLGETFCLLVLTRPGFDAAAQRRLVARCAEADLRATAQQLVLICQDFARELPKSEARAELERRHPEFARLPGWLGERNPALVWLRALAEGIMSPSALHEIVGQFPPQTLLLSDLAASSTIRIINLIERQDKHILPFAMTLILATAYVNAVFRLNATQEHEKALLYSDGGVAFLRPLAEVDPPHFGAFLVALLVNRADALQSLGRHEQALLAVKEAERFVSESGRLSPDERLKSYVSVQSALSSCLAAMGDVEEALDVSHRLAEVIQSLLAKRHAFCLSKFADILHNLATNFARCGRIEDAISVFVRAEGIYHSLALQWPDQFMIDLARCLSNLAEAHWRRGDCELSICRYEEALSLHSNMSSGPVGQMHFAELSLTISRKLAAMKRFNEAMVNVNSSIEYMEKMIKYNAWVAGALAEAYDVKATLLADMGHNEEALAFAKKALTTFESMPLRERCTRRREWAQILSNLGSAYLGVECAVAACRPLRRALALERLLQMEGDPYAEVMSAGTLAMLGGAMRMLGRTKEAFALTTKAITKVAQDCDKFAVWERKSLEQLRAQYLAVAADAGKNVDQKTIARIEAMLRRGEA